jgi:hypothetical protein
LPPRPKVVSTIAESLASLGMFACAQRLAENCIDLSILPDMTDQHLEKLSAVSWSPKTGQVAKRDSCP